MQPLTPPPVPSSSAHADVVVVGGGLAGLGAAAYLSRAGLAVRVFERASALGGRASTTQTEGFCLNRGAHALGLLGEGKQVLDDLGVDAPGRVVVPGGRALSGGALYQLPVGALSLMTTGLLGLASKTSAAKWLDRVPRLHADDLDSVSVADWLTGLRMPGDVRALMEALVRVATYANAPDVFSAGTAVRQLQRVAKSSVLYVDGGWQTLVGGLEARATAHGALVEAGARVVSIAPTSARTGAEHGHYRVTLGDGRAIDTRAVVLAVSPRDAATLITSAGVRAPASLSSSPPVRTAALDIALSGLPPGERFVLGIDQPLYLSVHTEYARLGPPGGAVIHLMKYLPGGPDAKETDPDLDRAELEALLDKAYPGWQRRLVHAQYLPRMCATERLDLAIEGGVRGRPGTVVEGLPDVVLAGDWVQGGAAIADAALGSAREAATVVAERLARAGVPGGALAGAQRPSEQRAVA